MCIAPLYCILGKEKPGWRRQSCSTQPGYGQIHLDGAEIAWLHVAWNEPPCSKLIIYMKKPSGPVRLDGFVMRKGGGITRAGENLDPHRQNPLYGNCLIGTY